jgi:peptidyl-prolyl cis-trans isomerase A (cyclophilin A)
MPLIRPLRPRKPFARFPFAATVAAALIACSGTPNPTERLQALPPGDYAWLQTTMGDMAFRLFSDKTPKTVANFIGLANGFQPYYDPVSESIHTGHFYDGLLFSRFIPDFAVQGGDINNTGTGTPGYRFEDEFDPTLRFDRAGLLAMANSGANANGSQIFITLGPAAHLNDRHTLFGEVALGADVVEIINKSPQNRFQRDTPLDPIVMKFVRVYTVGPDGSVKPAAMPDVPGGLPQPQPPAAVPSAQP